MGDLSSSRRVLVTGGSGFIGTNLIGTYTAAGIACAGYDPVPPRSSGQHSLWTEGDVRDSVALGALIASFEPTHLFHLGARTDMEGPGVEDYAANTDGVQGVIDALASLPEPPRTVFASTRLVTPVGYVPADEFDVRPDTAYGRSKVIGEQLVRESGLANWTIVRPTSIWGPWFGTPYRQFFDNVLKGRYVHPRGLEVSKTFGFVDNSVAQLDAISLAPAEQVLGKTFYIGDPPIEVGAFGDAIAAGAGLRKPRRVPLWLLGSAARGGDLGKAIGLFGDAPLTSTRLRNIRTDMVFDISSTIAVAGEPPIGVDEGIARTLAWIRGEAGEPAA